MWDERLKNKGNVDILIKEEVLESEQFSSFLTFELPTKQISTKPNNRSVILSFPPEKSSIWLGIKPWTFFWSLSSLAFGQHENMSTINRLSYGKCYDKTRRELVNFSGRSFYLKIYYLVSFYPIQIFRATLPPPCLYCFPIFCVNRWVLIFIISFSTGDEVVWCLKSCQQRVLQRFGKLQRPTAWVDTFLCQSTLENSSHIWLANKNFSLHWLELL